MKQNTGAATSAGGTDSTETVTCGVATMRLLAKYGVDTVFGIPGVHTLELYRGLHDSPIRHVQVRNEQGAGFMADGYARVTGKPGVALVISGPGVTNTLTAIGQAFADSIPMLMLSSETQTPSLGKGWGALHEITDQRAVTAPLTALSMRANTPADVPEMLGQAFAVFSGQRPRPVHLSIPVDVLAMSVADEWDVRVAPDRPQATTEAIDAAIALLRSSRRPLLMVGGGAVEASAQIRELVEQLNIPVVASSSGKGVVPDIHPLSLSASLTRPEVQRYVSRADVVLAVGTELAETDSFVERLEFNGDIIRIDLDVRKINDQYPATVGIVADAATTIASIVAEGGFADGARDRAEVEDELMDVRRAVGGSLNVSEQQHYRLLSTMYRELPADTIYVGDSCQLVYTGAFAMVASEPRTWIYPSGYCTLGSGLPNAIGAKLSLRERPIVCLVGDGGVMFTIQELIVAAEEGLGIPIIIWDNGGLKQIQDDMRTQSVPLVGVEGRNPDFVGLARSLGADAVVATSLEHAVGSVNEAFSKDRPTVVVVKEGEPWLT